jgi:hypothetical protein
MSVHLCRYLNSTWSSGTNTNGRSQVTCLQTASLQHGGHEGFFLGVLGGDLEP